MVKSLADELTDILNWVENPGLGEHAHEDARMGLVIFCRGLVCGLRSAQQVTGDTPISVDDALAEAFKHDCDKAEVKRRMNEARCREERRHRQENEQRNEPKWDPEAPADLMAKVDVGFRGGNRPSIDEALKDLGCVPDCH